MIPGAIDVHIHGVNNADAMDGTAEALKQWRARFQKKVQQAFSNYYDAVE